jgi:hypothetical protein
MKTAFMEELLVTWSRCFCQKVKKIELLVIPSTQFTLDDIVFNLCTVRTMTKVAAFGL